MSMLYEICPMCNDTGVLRDCRTNNDPVARDRPCPGCKPLRVVPTGATSAQLESAVRRCTAYEAALRELAEAVAAGRSQEPGRLSAALASARHVLALRGRAA